MNHKPLVPEDLVRVRPAAHLARAATAHLRGYVKKSTPEYVVAQMWGRDPVTVEVLRAATAPATTTTSGWAKELARVAVYDLVQSTTSISAGAQLIDRGLQLSLDGIAELRVPGRVLNAAAASPIVCRTIASMFELSACSCVKVISTDSFRGCRIALANDN